MLARLLLLMLSVVCASISLATPACASPALRLAGSYYVDSREFATASLAMSSDRLPAAFTFWGFTDFHGAQDSRELPLIRSFSEYRLSHAVIGQLLGIAGLGLQAELNALSGSGNDLVRYGLTYKHAIKLPWGRDAAGQGWLQWRAFPFESDRDGGQASVVFYLPLSERLLLKGFADYNIASSAANRWVIEPELSLQLSERLSALLEFRYNGYEDANPAISGAGVALGIRYQLLR